MFLDSKHQRECNDNKVEKVIADVVLAHTEAYDLLTCHNMRIKAQRSLLLKKKYKK